MLPNNDSYTHYVKSERIRSNSGPHFPEFGLNTERYRPATLLKKRLRWYRCLPGGTGTDGTGTGVLL